MDQGAFVVPREAARLGPGARGLSGAPQTAVRRLGAAESNSRGAVLRAGLFLAITV